MTTFSTGQKSKWGKYKYRIVGLTLTFFSFLVIAYILVLNGRATPLSTLDSVLFGIISIGLQTLSVYVFSKNGKADPALARTARNQLLSLIRQIHAARLSAEIGYENKTRTEDKIVLGKLSAQLSSIEEQTINAANIWREFHPDADFEMEGKDK